MTRLGSRAAVVIGVLLAAGSTAGVASATSAPARLVVAQGSAPGVLAGAKPLAATAASAPVRISIVLKAQNLQALESGVTSGSFSRGHFLSVSQFAERYGQPAGVVSKIDAFLRQHGLHPTPYRDRLVIPVRGTAAQINKVFGVTLRNYLMPAQKRSHGQPARPAQVIHGTTQAATLPAWIAQRVLAVLGLTSYNGAYQSTAIPARQTVHAAPAGVSGPPPTMLVPQDFLQNYHGTQLAKNADEGAGSTIGIVTLASLPVKDAYRFWKAIGLHVAQNRIKVVDVDGGSGPISYDAGSDETVLDVQQSGAIASRAKLIVYQAPNTDYGFIDGFFAAASANRADSVSASWAESETYLRAVIALGTTSPAYAQAFNEAMLEGAAQGQAEFNSSGDEGAYEASADLGSTNLSVINPQDSPYITSAGGTTLSSSQDPQFYGLPSGKVMQIVIPNERTWGWDYLDPEYQQFARLLGLGSITEQDWAKGNVVGSGGGASQLFAMPSYQATVPGIADYSGVHYLTPISFTNVFPGVGSPLPFNLPSDWAVDLTPGIVTGNAGDHRLTPDLSTDADPQTGYAVYTRLYKPIFGSNWVQFGGTSFVAPQLNGVSALIQSLTGGRVGFWNPAIYRFADSANSPFTPLNAQGSIAGTTVQHSPGAVTFTVPGSNNIFYTGQPGSLYNMGSGLGIPNLGALGKHFWQITH